MTILGSSPEMLVRVTGKKLEYRPIAGTRKRGKDEADDLSWKKSCATTKKNALNT